ncbi:MULTISPECIES: DinB family protein [Okeania]|uniref:Damage-inducible protein DinB n=1 Tax=Okeania hirsuta TaxID=1458930 RepID=A0A3N6PK99_9CYAN|nr:MULTISPECIES: DinB family protein [Okeania]NES89317.1 damage-inducible protein DinB [Okeania sp. SIO2B9]NET76740.1 damage-inducible protein DinB [Okeania sp. SIO1F9]RQH15422.1 damage-inducible protein DinB [Okeania hirsuta]RQH57499.1 damage-inducible protein DinB [Okeania hirsuta]
MKTTDYFQRLSQYNQWMNEKIYQVCASIPDEIRREDKRAFFNSIHGTLNHILLADKLWLSRFENYNFEIESLRQELIYEFDLLWEERQKTDKEIQSYIDSLTDEKLSETLTFTSRSQKRECTFPVWFLLLHFFNHQTHHRGQLTTLISQCGKDFGVTDLLWLPEAEL